MAIVDLKDVHFQYEDAQEDAVKGVSMHINPGEFVAVLGHNGSGKSTLAKLLNALYLPSAGEVIVCGMNTKDDKHLWDIRQTCGMVFQNPDNQMVATVVEEDVAFGLENIGIESSLIRSRVDSALETVGMERFAESAPHMLSGGQKQRIAIAGVLAMRPQIMVFDESTAMLDPSGRLEVLNTVMQLNKQEGMTVVWITHFMEEAARADRVIVMDQGQIALEGSPREVFAQSEKITYLGLDLPPMEILSETLRAHDIDLPSGILTVDEMVVELCRLKSAN